MMKMKPSLFLSTPPDPSKYYMNSQISLHILIAKSCVVKLVHQTMPTLAHLGFLGMIFQLAVALTTKINRGHFLISNGRKSPKHKENVQNKDKETDHTRMDRAKEQNTGIVWYLAGMHIGCLSSVAHSVTMKLTCIYSIGRSQSEYWKYKSYKKVPISDETCLCWRY